MSPPAAHWRLLGELLRPHRARVAGLGVLLAMAAALPLGVPQLLRAFIDAVVAGAPTTRLVAIAAAVAGLGLAAQALSVMAGWGATALSWTVTNRLRERAAAHALDLDLGFHLGTTPGAMIERVDGDVTAIADFFSEFAAKIVSGLLTLVGVVVLVTVEDHRLGLSLLLLVVVTGALVVRLRDGAVRQQTAARAAHAALFGEVEERVAGAEDLRALGSGEHALERFRERSASVLSTGVTAELAGARVWMVLNGVIAGAGVAVLAIGAVAERRGAMTVGTVFLLLSYTRAIRRPLELVAEQLQRVQKAAAGASRVARLLDERPTMPTTGRRSLPSGPLAVDLDAVDFAYGDERVLSGIDLHLAPGRVLGVVGRTGSGKTTLGRLALRLADPTGGAVRLGGVDAREVDHEVLRARVAVVTQDVQLFSASVRDNLTLFRDGADDAALEGALDEVGLRAWRRGLPDGLATVVGAHGIGLSAGEAQLLALARVFLADPGLVVLDEASSRVDPATERLVTAALERLVAGRTAVVVTHRLAVLEHAHEVAVLDSGRLVEHGGRDALADDPRSRLAGLLALEAVA